MVFSFFSFKFATQIAPMNRLSKHILSLLRLYDSVALPGAGFFNLSYIAGHIDNDTASFLPPRFSLSFIPDSSADDGLLLASYIRKERCPEDMAASMLQSDVNALKAALEDEGRYSLPGVGEFNLEDGILSFDDTLDLNPPLPVLALPGREVEIISQQTVVPPAFESPQESDVSSRPLTDNSHYRNPDYYYIPVHRKFARIVACVCLVAVVALATVIPIGRPRHRANSASITPLSTVTVTPHADYESVEADEVYAEDYGIDDATDYDNPDGYEDNVASPQLHAISYDDEQSPDRYYAVVAAFKSKDEADKFINSHEGNKLRFRIIKNSSYYLVTVASSNDKAELETGMPLIRADYPDAWIFSLLS